jgi:hypothetical protein
MRGGRQEETSPHPAGPLGRFGCAGRLPMLSALAIFALVNAFASLASAFTIVECIADLF